jgi:hypothetical protein
MTKTGGNFSFFETQTTGSQLPETQNNSGIFVLEVVLSTFQEIMI